MGIIYKNGIPYGNQPNGTVPSGGTTGQVLKKASNTDYDTEWANESGGGGTSDYTQLSNKPQINSVTLTGNKTGAQLGLVDAVTGKQLSTEDYTTAEKTKLAGIEAQANKTVIDDTLTNTGEAADAKAVGDELNGVKNTLNQLAKYKNIGNNVSLSALKTALLSEASALDTAGLKSELVMFTCIDSPFTSSLPVEGYLTIHSNIYFSCMASDSKGNAYILSYYNGTWFVDTLVPQSKALKYGESTAKLVNAVTVPSAGAVVEVQLTNSMPIPLSRVKYILSCRFGVNPAGVIMTVAQGYNGDTGIFSVYLKSDNAQTVNAGTDVIIYFIYV
jgi:hypothetical protein